MGLIKVLLREQQQNNISNLNDNFKRWFQGSKIVDKSGNPLVVYHGSTSEFSEFEGDAYFTDDYYNADGYASGEFVYEVYLQIKRPLVIDCQERKWDELNSKYGATTRDIVGNVDRNKYDGVIFNNVKDSWIDDEDFQDPSTVYVTFKPNQIKSVENSGEWNGNSGDIYD